MVWTTTVGAVLGPNLVGPGEAVGAAVGMPPLTGAYAFTIVSQLAAITLYLTALRPDPLRLAQQVADARDPGAARIVRADRPAAARYATVAIVGAHGVMVAIMAMTPLHLLHHGATLSVVGVTISLHIAGMFALSPVFGLLSDRWGRVPTIVLGYAILAGCVAVIACAQHEATAVSVALVLLGLGWSAATVAGSALLTEASDEQTRTSRQGRTDFAMSLVGAIGAAGAGVVLTGIGFDGLALATLPVLAAVVALARTGRLSAG
ncbi:MFS transporter [Micropruina sp.]|uniref:MFS transporter n=1 Tax=Micropruina sp. TaxID=2737536 RepID=UPI0039E42673